MERVSQNTNRTRQEPALGHCGLALRARVFATRGLRDRKALANPVGLKKVLAKSKRREKSYIRFKMGTQNRQCGWRGHGPDRSQKSLDFGHLPVVNSKGEPNFGILLPQAVRADFDADWRI